MALGDGSSWDETLPTNDTFAVLIDDHIRDLRVGVRSRMALEHEWPGSQSATSEAGRHKFITLQNLATKPTLSGTQVAGVYTKTVGAGLQELYWENEAGTEVQLTKRGLGNSNFIAHKFTSVGTLITATSSFPMDNSIPQVSEGHEILTLTVTPSSTNHRLWCSGVIHGAPVSAGEAIGAIFLGTTADALACGFVRDNVADLAYPIAVDADIAVTSTTAQSFSLRVGAISGTYLVNGYDATQKLGGNLSTRFFITEYST